MEKNSATKTPDTAADGPREASEPKPAEPGSEAGASPAPREIGGRGGLDPVRYGDWEKNGRCIDF